MKAKFNNPFIKLLCVAAMLAVVGASQVSATTLNFGDGYDLGLINPNHPADPTSSTGYIDTLLSQPAPSGPTTIGANTYYAHLGRSPRFWQLPRRRFQCRLDVVYDYKSWQRLSISTREV
jgi:hypothetical protein